MTQASATAKTVLVDDRTYTVLTIKRGGMGRVWILESAFGESFDPIYKRRIAVKTFDVNPDNQRIEQELNIWISLQSPLILPLKKIGRLNYRLAAIMPLLQGSLDDFLDREGSLAESKVSQIIGSVAEGLDYAWSAFNILHLDLKPSNVLIEDQTASSIKIADWGISRLTADRRLADGFSTAKNSRGSYDLRTAYAAGTPLFMAPERFSGGWRLSPSVDIYSLGMMAIQLNTGILPFRFGEVDPTAEIATGTYFENASAMLADRSDLFRTFCLSSIHPDPSRRISSYRDLRARLSLISKKGIQ